MKFGSQSEVNRIKYLLLKHPRAAFLSQENIRTQWKELNYSSSPDYGRAVEEYDEFIQLLERFIPEIHFLPADDRTGLDSIYVHDSLAITDKGALLCRMGKEKRQGEPLAAEEFLKELGIPIIGSITGEGKLEGGDVVWIDERTIAVGLGYRTNEEGVRQLKELTSDSVDEYVKVPLPHWEGPEDVMHLMSLISPVRRDLAVVYSRLLPVPFREWLLQREIRLLEVPDTEFETMGCNVLAVAPGECIMISGNPQTKRLLEEAGVQVHEYEGEEISRKGAGGPTCLTRPLLREKD
ncbi:MAG: arginine deiminase family protein [Candidatus Aminicenantes bacterium]|jgi:N-dimethylarginine dimethylaminohydrolase